MLCFRNPREMDENKVDPPQTISTFFTKHRKYALKHKYKNRVFYGEFKKRVLQLQVSLTRLHRQPSRRFVHATVNNAS